MGRTKLHKLQAELKDTKAELGALKREKEALRVKTSEGLPLGDHLTILSAGVGFEAIYIHTALMPSRVKRWIASHGLINNLFYPLHAESADTLRRYRLFLYTGKVASKDEDSPIVKEDEAKDREWHELVLMYHFARKIQDEKFGNSILDALVEKVQEEERWPTDLAFDVYDETSIGDVLRRLYVDLHVWVGQGSGIEDPYEDRNGPEEFCRDVKIGLIIAGSKVSDPSVAMPWEKNLCALYHTHFDTPVCGTANAEVIDLTAD